MGANSFGKIFSITTFGESHGEALGVIIDGMPSRIAISVADLQRELDRRAPGKDQITSSRKESDIVNILSGVFEDQTLGTPICALVFNKDQKSDDYEWLKNPQINRIGHADSTTLAKFGIRDHRGGGRSSGRETVARVIGGYFASLIIPEVKFNTTIISVGKIEVGSSELSQDAKEYLMALKKNGDSAGTKISLTISNVPAGIGAPVFNKIKADLAKAMLSIGGCTSFSYGAGEALASALGSEISDRQIFGGIEGGISNGDNIFITMTFKPPSTVGGKAKNGRHDPCLVPRVIPVVEAMAKITIADHYLQQKIYEK